MIQFTTIIIKTNTNIIIPNVFGLPELTSSVDSFLNVKKILNMAIKINSNTMSWKFNNDFSNGLTTTLKMSIPTQAIRNKSA